ncbi:MAG: polysaccharide biosynthesis protein [Melioribacteraceae bacterium]|nr:MAG: polysaccharide biosynthesis protein [Melioribacteraceae bacterium]
MLDKLKQLSKETAIYGASTIVGRFLNFLLVPFYTNVFSREEFGIYTFVYAILAFLNIVYIYGMDAAFMKYSADAEREGKRAAFSTPFIFVTGTSSIFTVVMLLGVSQISDLMALPAEYSHLTLYMIFILLFDTIALIPFADLRLERKAKKFAAFKLINIFVNLTLNLILILYYKMGIEAIFISNLVASAAVLLLLIPDIVKKLVISVDRTLLKKMFRFGIFFLPASITAMMVQMIDVPIVTALTDYATVGLYRANYKLGIFMMLVVQMFNYAWQPFFLTNAKEKNAKEIFSKVLTLFVLFAGFIWLFLTVIIDDIVHIHLPGGRTLIGADFVDGFYIVPVILLAYVFHGMYYNFTAGLYIKEKTSYFPWVTGVGAIVNVAVNYALIPLYGIMGAAIATLASYVVMAAGLYFSSSKFYKINYEWGKISIIMFLISGSTVVYYFALEQNGLPLLYKFILPAFFIAILFITRVIRVSEIKTVLKSFKKK